MRWNIAVIILMSLLLVFLAAGCAGRQAPDRESGAQGPTAEDAAGDASAAGAPQPDVGEQAAEQPPQQPEQQQAQAQSSWRAGGTAIAGTYADADVVALGDGTYRMYYSIEPEVPGNKLEVFSATSADGRSWSKEAGVRKEFATFPDVVRLPDGRFRMYFQNAGVIKSAISKDGLSWADEPGTRIGAAESGFTLENVGAMSTMLLADGTYAMVYRGTINEPYQATERVPNRNTQLYFWATSRDGLAFEKKGLAFDSRNDVLLGLADGAEWVRWDGGELRVYFWSYTGVYHSVYRDGAFSEPVFDFTTSEDMRARFPPNPPGDPTLAKIGGTWFMYYGQHTKGIYYATYDQQEPEDQTQSLASQPAEALMIPASIEGSCVGFKISSPNRTATIQMIGAGWATLMGPHFTWGRIEREPGLFDFSEMDAIVRTAQENNVALLAEMQPFADWDQASDEDCRAKEREYLCKPKDVEAYKKFVAKTVERYDGDGEDDMPGLSIPVKYWQIINEPDMKDDPHVIFFVGNGRDYVDVLRESYLTIKQVCPDCKVLHGAAAGMRSDMLAFWDEVFRYNGDDYFDIANIHYVGIDAATGQTVGLGDLSTLNVGPFKDYLEGHDIDKPIWVTEAVLESSSARSSLQGALSAGASKVFFLGFGVEEPASLGDYSAAFEGVAELCPTS